MTVIRLRFERFTALDRCWVMGLEISRLLAIHGKQKSGDAVPTIGHPSWYRWLPDFKKETTLWSGWT